MVEHDFAMFRLSFAFIVSLRHAWLFGVRPTAVLPLGHELQAEAWPDRVERLVVEHDYVLSHCLHSKALPDCIYW